MNLDAVFEVNINSSLGTSDFTMVNGALTLNNANLSINDLGASVLALGTRFDILSFASESGTFLNLTDGSDLTVGLNTFQINYGTAVPDTVTLTAVVPEPKTGALVAAGVLMLLALRFKSASRLKIPQSKISQLRKMWYPKICLSGALALVLFSGESLNASVEVHTEFQDQAPGRPSVEPHPSQTSPVTQPSEVVSEEASGLSVKIEEVEKFKARALVLRDDDSAKNAGVVFGGLRQSEAFFDGKVFMRFNWLTIDNRAGNVGFITFKNSSGKMFLSLRVGKSGDLLVEGQSKESPAEHIEVDQPTRLDIELDLASWTYSFFIDGIRVASQKLIETDDKSFLNVSFSSATTGESAFALKSVDISTSPIDASH